MKSVPPMLRISRKAIAIGRRNREPLLESTRVTSGREERILDNLRRRERVLDGLRRRPVGCPSTVRSNSRPRRRKQEIQSRRRQERRKSMLQAQSLEIGTTGALGWISKAAGERMWKRTTPVVIPTLRPMLRSTGHHHLDHRNPHTTRLHDQDRSRNLPEEALQPLMRKTKMRTNGIVSMGMPKNTLSVHKDLAYPVDRVLLDRIGDQQRTDSQNERVVVTVTSDLSRQRAGDHPLMLRRHAHLPCLPTTPRQLV
jgi:hypothetical protein